MVQFLDIRNLAALPRGTGCPYLLCIKGQDTELVAKRWARKIPLLAAGEVLVSNTELAPCPACGGLFDTGNASSEWMQCGPAKPCRCY